MILDALRAEAVSFGDDGNLTPLLPYDTLTHLEALTLCVSSLHVNTSTWVFVQILSYFVHAMETKGLTALDDSVDRIV